MDPTKNPVDPNRSPTPDLNRIEPAVTTPTSPDPGWTTRTDQRASRQIDAGESLLSDMVEEFGDPTVPRDASVTDEPRFDIGLFGLDQEGPNPEARHYDERDFQSHRRESFGQTHQTLRPIHSTRSSRRKISSGGRMGTDNAEGLNVSQSEGQIVGQNIGGSTIDAIEEEDLMPESWPLLPPSGHGHVQIKPGPSTGTYQDFMDSPLKKVQFEVGGSPYHSAADDVETPAEKKKHKARTQKYEDPQWRLTQGSDMPLMLRAIDHTDRPELSLAADMPEQDKDDLSSHRFHDTKGFRRHKFYPKGSEGGGGGSGGADRHRPLSHTAKARYNHQTHEIFVELDMLSGHGEGREWQETARWIKYEEDLEEGADRWGKPHVASLSFHSLINLRRLLESGVVLMDLEERDLPGVAYRVVDQMGMNDLIRSEEKATVLRSLLLKHKHVDESAKSAWLFGNRRNTGSLTSLAMIDNNTANRAFISSFSVEPVVHRRGSVAKMLRNDSMLGQAAHGMTRQSGDPHHPHSHPHHLQKQSSSPAHIALDMAKLSGSGLSEEDMRWITSKEAILRRIPTGAEASIVLVGEDDTLEGPTLAFTRLAESVYMPNITEVPIPVRFVFILMGPSSSDLDYREIGRSISTLMSNPQFHDIAYKADTRKDLLKGIHEFLDESIVLPPGDWDDELFPFEELKQKSKDLRLRKERMSTQDKTRSGNDIFDSSKTPPGKKLPEDDDPFRKTGCYFGGIKNDIKKRYTFYWSDLKDGFNLQCLATIIFLYFACVAGGIAFGGLMAKKTNNYIGITETLIGTSIGGILFALGSGQPLLLLGTTGPLLVFDESLFNFCESMGMNGLEFLAVRLWIGLWIVVIGLLVAFFEGAVIVRYFTRFTIEIFATYISFVFIVESFNSLIQIYREHPLLSNYGSCEEGDVREDSRRPNVALLGTILMFGTFSIAYFFRSFRTSGYLTKSIRNVLGNFAVLIALISMSTLDFFIVTSTDKLDLPNAAEKGLRNSIDERDWIVNPLNLKLFWIAASILPALLLYILVFMETSITELIIGKKEMKLKKGGGLHLDVVVICGVNAIMGILGTCWISSAIVRGVAHTTALIVYSTNNPPGEKPTIIAVKEQRITGLAVSFLLGLSVLMANVLKLIPLPVLFGIFLFMGVSSMAGIQFIERFTLLFKQVQNHPQVPYVRRVRTWKMHLFTVIQILSLSILWGVKESPAALSLPLIIILLIPFRLRVLKFWFTPLELAALDAQGNEPEEPPQKPLTIAILPSPEKYARNGTFQAEENGKSLNGTVNDFRSI